MPLLITIDDVRNKNKDLLLTDKILDSDIETCIIDATETVMTRLNEVFDEPINDLNVTSAMKLCIKLIASSNCIRDNYSDNEMGLSVANSYFNEAQNNIKSIVAGNKLQKQGILPHKRTVSYDSVSDNSNNTIIDRMNCYYR